MATVPAPLDRIPLFVGAGATFPLGAMEGRLGGQIHIHADRRLAFQVLTAFGTGHPDGGSSRVLEEGDRGKLVEFRTPMPTLRGGKKVYWTVEWVTLNEPEEIAFQGVDGPLALLKDRFVLEDVGGCTRFRYERTFGVRGSILGWLLGRFYVKPLLSRFMREHARKLKETIEDRAKRSRVFSYRECGTIAE